MARMTARPRMYIPLRYSFRFPCRTEEKTHAFPGSQLDQQLHSLVSLNQAKVQQINTIKFWVIGRLIVRLSSSIRWF